MRTSPKTPAAGVTQFCFALLSYQLFKQAGISAVRSLPFVELKWSERSSGGLFSIEMPEIAAFQHMVPVLTCLPCHFLGSGNSFCVLHCQSAVILHSLLFYLFMFSIYISHLWIKANLFWPLFLYRCCNYGPTVWCISSGDLGNTEISNIQVNFKPSFEPLLNFW